MDPPCAVDLLTPTAMRGVIDRQRQLRAIGDEVGHHQIEQGQADLVDLPARDGEEIAVYRRSSWRARPYDRTFEN